jgi:hypothetical protein
MSIQLKDDSQSIVRPKQREVRVDLHSLGKLFLNKKTLKLYDFSIILHL